MRCVTTGHMTADDDDRSGLRVRPYAITGGRTRSTHGGADRDDRGAHRQRARAALGARPASRRATSSGSATTPLSVAEISAHLHLPLGVARVLVGDMTDEGLVDFNRSQAGGDRPSLRLLERVFDGLQAL